MPVQAQLTRYLTGYRRADGAAAMEALMQLPEPPDAVFCFTDLLALGGLRALNEQGVRVPDDVAVVGFDDLEESRYSCPSLSTIAPAKRHITQRAVEILDERISGRQNLPRAT